MFVSAIVLGNYYASLISYPALFLQLPFLNIFLPLYFSFSRRWVFIMGKA